MNTLKAINVQEITYLDVLEGSTQWYWGSDYFHGDLYEAEEIFKLGHEITSNKLVFIKYPNGQVFEPIKPQKGHYFGKPIFYNNSVVILIVNFMNNSITLVGYQNDFKNSNIIATIPLNEITDCYNLFLVDSPLLLARRGHDDIFDIIYPQKLSFKIGERESFAYLDEDKLYFSNWYEDPNYREEVIVRDIATGEIIDTFKGSIKTMPNGEKWLLT